MQIYVKGKSEVTKVKKNIMQHGLATLNQHHQLLYLLQETNNFLLPFQVKRVIGSCEYS